LNIICRSCGFLGTRRRNTKPKSSHNLCLADKHRPASRAIYKDISSMQGCMQAHQRVQCVKGACFTNSLKAPVLVRCCSTRHCSATDTPAAGPDASIRSNLARDHQQMQLTDHRSNKLTPWPGTQHQVCAAALAAVQACTAVLAGHLAVAEPSWAVLNSPNARIPRTVDAALRR